MSAKDKPKTKPIVGQLVGVWADACFEVRPVAEAGSVDLLIDSDAGSRAFRLSTEEAMKLAGQLSGAATFATVEQRARQRNED